MLIAEEFLLLVTDDASGRLSVPGEQVDIALGGANLIELALMKKVDVSGQGDVGKPGHLVVRDASPPGDPVLDAALSVVLAHQGRKPSAVLRPLGKNLRQTLYQRLAASGVIRAEQGRILGVFPARRWPAQDTHHEGEVRRLIIEALVRQAVPGERTAALIALAHALRCELKIVDPRQYNISRRQLRARADEIAKGDWASGAVRKAIDEMMAAIVAAVTASTASTVAAGSS